jgi:kojibiose phosphorylase
MTAELTEALTTDTSICDWDLRADAYHPEDEGLWETLFTLSNGFFGCRGNLELPSARRDPGVFLAGVYDKPDRDQDSDTFGLQLKNKAISPAYAIAPVFNLVELLVDGKPLDFFNGELLEFDRRLDMRNGQLLSRYTLADAEGRRLRICFYHAALLTQANAFVTQCSVESLDAELPVALRFLCQQTETPHYIPRLKDYVSHTRCLEAAADPDGGVRLRSRVHQTGTTLFCRARTIASTRIPATIEPRPGGVAESFYFTARPGESIRFDRCVTLEHDAFPTDVPGLPGGPVADLLDVQAQAWSEKWAQGDCSFDGDACTLTGLRWSLFSLHQLGHFSSPHYSIAATGLHGQGYFGHVFWDTEIFMLPFYLLTHPDTARNLLAYRFHRLDAARVVAREHGFAGAKFPWTSTRDGYDVCPPDWDRCGKRQIHISGDISYAFELYRKWTDDQQFHDAFGIEVIVETARFFRSRMQQGGDGKFHILDVIGPDEYNIHADDNYYTNMLAQWNLHQAVSDMVDLSNRDPARYRGLCQKLSWTADEARELQEAADRIAFPRIHEGICEQYQGFFDLKDIGEIQRDENNMPMEKLHAYDQGYQILKQADAVMMHYLFPGTFSRETEAATFRYYEKRNSFGSSLSPSISCLMGLRLGLEEHAYGYFKLTSLLDVQDLHTDKNTDEGLHAACAGGAALCGLQGFGGISVGADGILCLDPRLPGDSVHLKCTFQFRKRHLLMKLTSASLHLELHGEPMTVRIKNRDHLLTSTLILS